MLRGKPPHAATEPKPRPDGLSRGPKLHATSLFLFGLTSVLFAGLSLLHERWLPGELALVLLLMGAWGCHALWLTVIVRDAANLLDEELAIGPVRTFLVAVSACILFPAWSALCLGWLARDLSRALQRRERLAEAPGLARVVQQSSEVLFLAAIALATEWWLNFELAAYARIEGRTEDFVSQIELLGAFNAGLLTAFRLGAAAYYLSFLARAVPILYSAYAVLAPTVPPTRVGRV